MSRRGNWLRQRRRRAVFWSLKHERIKHETLEGLDAGRLSVFKYVETFYNTERSHQSLGFKNSKPITPRC